MKIFLTIPSFFARHFKKNKSEYPGIDQVFSDPENLKLGSAGGSVNVLWQAYRQEIKKLKEKPTFQAWLKQEKRMIIHSDGQSRRLPAYAPFGKSFIPFPVFRWERGQHIRQSLFDVQRPLLTQLLERSPKGMNTMIVSGDAMIYTQKIPIQIPEADVLCLGVWANSETASKHGVFVCNRKEPAVLEFMLQKPSAESLQHLTNDYLFLLDAGIWILSDKAAEVLIKKCGWDKTQNNFPSEVPGYYDLYAEFGKCLGKKPSLKPDTSLSDFSKLKTIILTPEEAGFYHFGTNGDLLKSATALHNRITDQREIWHKKIKPSPEIFIQNAVTQLTFTPENNNIWIDNSYINKNWKLSQRHIITGVFRNEWKLRLPEGICLDFIPVEKTKWCIRFYGYDDTFRGQVQEVTTTLLNEPAPAWFEKRMLKHEEMAGLTNSDIYNAAIYPVLEENEITEEFLQWLLTGELGYRTNPGDLLSIYLHSPKLSSAAIIKKANHVRISAQRNEILKKILPALANNYRQSVFYQLDLKRLADEFHHQQLSLPGELSDEVPLMTRIHDAMFRAVYLEKCSDSFHRKSFNLMGVEYERSAFRLLKEGMMEDLKSTRVQPLLNIQPEQILWGRSPVRLDLAGGWTDTPPYCILFGGRVSNMAVELNGQPPLQVFIKPSSKPEIVIRSIDMGVSETVKTYDQLSIYDKVGSAFSIPKAALMLCGFHPEFSSYRYSSLKNQLLDFGGGFEISLIVAIPKGSGLGTSSILAATLLGTLSEFCLLGWDLHTLAHRTLILEQMLTTGGGWQDQFGGIFPGVKLIESNPGFYQKPTLKWAPEHLFTHSLYKDNILLYYTGINRVAKNILQDIVRGMFLNSEPHLAILSEMKQHAGTTFDALQNHDWEMLTKAIGQSWDLNCRLNSATSTPEILAMLNKIRDYVVAYKLLGAGSGGYLMIFTKDPKAAARVKTILQQNPPNKSARFVEWSLSLEGFKISRS